MRRLVFALLLAGLLYLAITVPLTHLVNWVDRRLREGRPDEGPTGPDAADPLAHNPSDDLALATTGATR